MRSLRYGYQVPTHKRMYITTCVRTCTAATYTGIIYVLYIQEVSVACTFTHPLFGAVIDTPFFGV